jgi:peptidoglycan/LPS O-acetylase OafA/YrhL
MVSYSEFREKERFGSLDGVRFLSIVPVMWHHAAERPLSGFFGRGALGVELFFVVSGFLITTLLLRERDAAPISLGRFYLRRALRIFPLYYAVLALYALHAWLFRAPSPQRAHFFESLPFYATYTANWFVRFGVPHPITFGFSWSLSTEEQFYAVWPFVLRFSRGLAVPAIVAACTLLFDQAIEHGMFQGAFPPGGYARHMIKSIATPVCLGALLAIALHHRAGFVLLQLALGRRASAPLSFAVLVLFVAIGTLSDLWIHLAMTALVGAVVIREDNGLARVLTFAPVRRIGAVSYGIYLFHVSIVTAWRALFPGAAVVLVFASSLAATWALAEASFRWFEAPFTRWRTRLRAVNVDAARAARCRTPPPR